MCGIAGVIWQDPSRPAERAVIAPMVAAIAHRGPDGEGIELLGPAALGHRRLSIIDLSEDGRQPMSNEDGTVWVVLNGEIYNFAALREELEAKGHRFRSRTDTEVLVHLYEEEGPELVRRLRGMFAFAIWDTTRGKLLLARDRAGQKPLHYRVDPDALRFASEPAALLADPSAPAPAFDPVAIHDYLHYGYVPSPQSAFRGAQKLPPAHTLEWSPGEAPRLRRYWDPSYSPQTRSHIREAIEEGASLLDEAVRLRTVADVPLGAFLSGGIDSGLIVSSLASLLSEPVRTFTIGFEEARYDEREGARAVADLYGTEHTERVVAADAQDLLPLLVARYGEPFADSSAIPTYRVAGLAREQVTVALSGDGGDELFAGYLRHAANSTVGLWGVAPRSVRSGVRSLVAQLPRGRSSTPLHYLHRFVEIADQPVEERNGQMAFLLQSSVLAGLYRPEFAAQVADADPLRAYRQSFRSARATRDEERVLWADFELYLPDDILTKVDIASMAHGLESRAPFLDHHLVEWAMRLPFAYKRNLREGKHLLRRLARRRLPQELVQAPKKGFSVPIDAWFRGPLLPLFRETVLAPDARSRQVFQTPQVERLLGEHLRRERNWHHGLWSILWLELWMRWAKL
jgi:asparagine synthase (glutamine-hydrolysing)